MKKRALISVSDKTGILNLSKNLIDLGYEIISTGGTYKLLKENNIEVIAVEEITHFPECLGGRVKTLHPNIHGGILAIRGNEEHEEMLKVLKIDYIDLVVVNLYPFKKTITNKQHTLENAIENIDIGGPTMLRAAAKNYKFVSVLTNPNQYDNFITKTKNNSVDETYRFDLAVNVFSHTASYDALISQYFTKVQNKTEYSETLTLTFDMKSNLRYGENPHQSAAYYEMPISEQIGLEQATLLGGKELSYNNINDATGAINLALEFTEPVCVAVKHATPCGVAVDLDVESAFIKARDCDPVSIFGGIVCFNREVNSSTAKLLTEIFLEVIIAPSYSDEALDILKSKPALRILALPQLTQNTINTKSSILKSVGGGLLVQSEDSNIIDNEPFDIVTKKQPTQEEINDMHFAMKVVKHVKSNAIVVAKDGVTLGIGGGQVNRIWAAQEALSRALKNTTGAVLASDAFFPFPDVVSVAGEYNVSAIIQPGGSKNDNASINECDKLGIAMAITGIRHFRH